MFVQVRMNWLTQLRRALFPPRPTPPAARHRRPCVEALDQRVVPSADIWIASGTAPVSWDTPAAWSLGAAPRAGDDVLLRTDAQGSGSAPVTLGHATPLLNSVTLDGSWAGTLTLQTDGQLNAHVITLDARTHTGDEILLDAGTEVHSDMALELSGGSIAGAGLVQAEGSIQVNGISMIDPPTLGGSTPGRRRDREHHNDLRSGRRASRRRGSGQHRGQLQCQRDLRPAAVERRDGGGCQQGPGFSRHDRQWRLRARG